MRDLIKIALPLSFLRFTDARNVPGNFSAAAERRCIKKFTILFYDCINIITVRGLLRPYQNTKERFRLKTPSFPPGARRQGVHSAGNYKRLKFPRCIRVAGGKGGGEKFLVWGVVAYNLHKF